MIKKRDVKKFLKVFLFYGKNKYKNICVVKIIFVSLWKYNIKMKDIVFYNYFHNGDIHASREFIKDIASKVTTNFFYYHVNSKNLLKDINVKFVDNIKPNNDKLFYEDESRIYLNTWFHPKYGHNKHGCSIEALYSNFKLMYEFLNIELEPIDYYIPSIDYSKFYVKKIDEFFNTTNYKKYIYISNGRVRSGQANNQNMDNVINKLSNRYKDYLFILSNDSTLKKKNVVLSKDIIRLNDNDLCENSYISTKCDYIVGRESGSFFFSYVKENVTGEKQQTIISICNIRPFLKNEYFSKNKRFLHLRNVDELLNIIK